MLIILDIITPMKLAKKFHSVDEAEKDEETAMEVDKPAGDEQPTGESILWFLLDRHAFIVLTW